MASSTTNPAAGLTVRTGAVPAGPTSVRVLTCTWNAGNARPPSDLAPWIPKNGAGYDVIVVGFQECTFKEKKKKAPGEAGGAGSPGPTSPGGGGGGEGSDDEDDEDSGAAATAAPHVADASHISVLEAQITGAAHKSARNAGAPGGAAAAPEQVSVSAPGSGSQASPASPASPAHLHHAVPSVSNSCVAFDVVRAHIGDGFAAVASLLMWQIGILAFVRNGVAYDEVATGSEATGLMGITPNKGGVAVKLRVGGTTRLVFVASHLAAHMKHVEHRNLNAVEIMDNIRFDNTLLDLDSQFHHCFWVGDLNYRVDLAIARGGELHVDNKERFAEVQQLIAAKDYKALLAGDQLRDSVRKGLAFSGFSEGDPSFTPTFKVRREPGFVHNPQRVSSWCDRVLWKSLPGLVGDVKQVTYAACPSVSTSDHKPVHASFDIALRAQTPVVPFPAGVPVASLKGPVIRVSKLKGSNLLGMDLSGKSDVYALFFADRDLRGPKEGKAPRTTTHRQTVHPEWADDQVDSMKISATTFADLAYAHLFVVLMDADVDADDRMGQVVLSLKDAAVSGMPVKFDLPVTKAGRTHGRLAGEVQVIWPTAAGDATEVRKRSGESCCAVM